MAYPSRNFLAFYHKSLIVLANMSKNRLPQHPSHTLLSFMPFARRHSHGSKALMTADAILGVTCRIELPLKPEAARGDLYTCRHADGRKRDPWEKAGS